MFRNYDQVRKQRQDIIQAREESSIAGSEIVPSMPVNSKRKAWGLDESDSYKGAHGLMLKMINVEKPVNNVQFYAGARKGSKYPNVVNFGLQYLLLQLENTIITDKHVESINALYGKGLGDFDYDTWMYIARDLGGIMPITVHALPEGVEVPAGVPLFTLETSDPKVAPVLGYLETFFSHLWYPMTVATQSREVKKIIKQFLDETSTNPEAIQFMLHDFGCRGVSSMETAGIGGSAHLVNFSGTDTIPGINHVNEYYGSSTMPGFSVNATEHSIMTSMGESGELEVIEKLLKFTTGILSVVVDSYDQYRITQILTTSLLPLVQARSGKVVLRPDSGEPVDVIKRLFEILSRNLESFITVNSKGFKVLPPFIGIIYGDGLSPAKIQQLLTVMKDIGWAADNLVFGMGGGLLQKVDRDTCRFAWKCCAKQTQDGAWHDVYKDPYDGKGTGDSKASLRGRQKVVKVDGVLQAVREDDPAFAHLENELKLVYQDGYVVKTYTFDEVRANASL